MTTQWENCPNRHPAYAAHHLTCLYVAADGHGRGNHGEVDALLLANRWGVVGLNEGRVDWSELGGKAYRIRVNTTAAWTGQFKALLMDSYLVWAHRLNLCHNGYLRLITWYTNQPEIKQSKWKKQNIYIFTYCLIILFSLLCVLFFFQRYILHSQSPLCVLPESIQVQKKFRKSYQTILQKACVIEGLPLVTMQSPKNKAQAISTVLEAMMRLVSRSRRYCKTVFTACVFIVDRKKGSHLMSTGWSWGRRAKAISVTLHGIVHATKPTISSRISGHLEQQQQHNSVSRIMQIEVNLEAQFEESTIILMHSSEWRL